MSFWGVSECHLGVYLRDIAFRPGMHKCVGQFDNSICNQCRSASRSWKTIFAVLISCDVNLSGNNQGNNYKSTLFHFRDKQEYIRDIKVPSLALDINGSHVEIPDNYTKKNNVFRLITEVGSESLYHANSSEVLEYWLDAIRHLHMTENASRALNEEGMNDDIPHNLSPPETIVKSEIEHHKRDEDPDSHRSHNSSFTRSSKLSGRQRTSDVLDKIVSRKLKQ